jgi:leucyl/phenylalanyl-tRNA--protein transferase
MRARLTELGIEPDSPFPAVETALAEPDGLLAFGGDLGPARLLNAYRHGCFPWYSQGQPILWWSPEPRLVLRTDGVHVSRSLIRALRKSDRTITADTRFNEVIRSCATIRRRRQHGTWILPEMIRAYERLHALGHAHCVEVADGDGNLVGGIYGVAIGRMFFGESMFSTADNGSKMAILALCRFLDSQGFPMIDCQMVTDHLRSLGAESMSRAIFVAESARLCDTTGIAGDWREAFGTIATGALADPALRFPPALSCTIARPLD